MTASGNKRHLSIKAFGFGVTLCFILGCSGSNGLESADQSYQSNGLNREPIISMPGKVEVTLPTAEANLSAAITDPDGSIQSVVWIQTQGPRSLAIQRPDETEIVVSNIVSAGIYKFQVTAHDNDDGVTSRNIDLIVYPEEGSHLNQYPVITLASKMDLTLPAAQITLSATVVDLDGSIQSIAWTQTGGTSTLNIESPSQESTVVRGFTMVGTYTFKVTAHDNEGGSTNKSIDVIVHPAGGDSKLNYNQHIKPIMTSYCISCHKVHLRDGLTTYMQVKKYVVIGNPTASPLYSRVYNNSMPKSRPALSEANKDKIFKWINDGALEETP